MNILVIGNGFDLAHNLPTKYGDFLHFIDALQTYDSTIHPVSTATEEENQFRCYFEALESNKPELFNELKRLAKDNAWIEYFMSILERKEKDEKNGWIDFESEISLIIQALDGCRNTLNLQYSEGKDRGKITAWQYKRLQPLLLKGDGEKGYLNTEFAPIFVPGRKKYLLDALNDLIRCLEIYLGDYVQNLPVYPITDIEALNIDLVLSFNYTNTVERLYSKIGGKDIDYDYIHGKADVNNNVESCKIVLGIDEYLPPETQDSDNAFIEFKKFYQRIYKATGSHYIDWLEMRRETARRMPKVPASELNIFIYGHSLDVTDKDILRSLILEPGAITTIYYYNKKDLGNKISNLVKVIGESELIRRTDGRNATIRFKETTK